MERDTAMEGNEYHVVRTTMDPQLVVFKGKGP